MQLYQFIRTIGWGLFCACSWTWCIGLYFPIILIDRYGWPGWVAFAVPNVIGAAAFGYVIKTLARSSTVVKTHENAMLCFSLVTVAFHIFFLDFLFTELNTGNFELWTVSVPITVIVWALALVLNFLPNRDWLILSVIVYAISSFAFVKIGLDTMPAFARPDTNQLTNLAWLTPVLVFGFLLCPYLDKTFHRAIQNTPSRHCFAIFGFTFLIMIVLTYVLWLPAKKMLPMIALAHILTQCLFTIGAHLREIRLSSCFSQAAPRLTALAIPLAAIGLLPILRSLSSAPEPGEEIYLRFMAFYGLVFPSYVLLFMTTKTERRHISRRMIAFACFLLVGLVLFEIGLGDGYAWLMTLPVIFCLFWAITVRRKMLSS